MQFYIHFETKRYSVMYFKAEKAEQVIAP